MAYSDYSATTPQENGNGETPNSTPPKKDNRKLIYGILIAALMATWGYLIYDNNKNNESIAGYQKQTAASDSERNVLQVEYNGALQRMDSLTGINTQLTGSMSQQKSEIDSLKAQIERIRREDNGDLTRAKGLIDKLNNQVTALSTQIEALKRENTTLTESNETLSLQRDTLMVQNKQVADSLQSSVAENKRIVDVASTLRAVNVQVQAIDAKGNNTKRAPKADLLRISFTIEENRIAASGEKTIYLVVTSPDGRVISNPAQGSGTFQTRDDGEKVYTEMQTINYTQGEKQQVSFNWRMGSQYQPGNYTVELYDNGYKIGEGATTLQKSGFLGL